MEQNIKSFNIELAKRWMDKFPLIAFKPESELIDSLLYAGQFDFLKKISITTYKP